MALAGMRRVVGLRGLARPFASAARPLNSLARPAAARLVARGPAGAAAAFGATSLGLGAIVGAAGWAAVAECEALVSPGVEVERKALVQKQKAAEEEDKVVADDASSDRHNWGILLEAMRQDKWLYALAALSSILGSLAASAQGRVVGIIFDAMGSGDLNALVGPLKSLLTLVLAQSGLTFLSSFALAVATTELGRRLRLAFYEASLRMDIAQFDESRTGELSHQLSQDIGALQTAVRTAFSRGIEGVTSVLSGSVYLYLASPKLAICMFGILPVMSGAAHLLGVLLRSLSDRIRRTSNRATGIANETLGAIQTVRVFGAEDRELARYAAELGRVAELKRKMALLAGGFYSALYLGINLITLVICGYGGYLVSNGELTRGGIAAVVTQVQILERSMARMSIVSAQLVKAFRSSEHIFTAIRSEPKVNTAKGGEGRLLRSSEVQGDVAFEQVRFTYPSRPGVTVLDDFSLRIRPGQVVALVGQSGSGKSTCSALISRLYDVQAGQVTIDGVDVRDIDPHSLHEVVGVVSQEPVLFSTSILDNIRYGKPDASMEEVEAAARAANAHDFVTAFPDGYNTELGERGVLLSGGQRQRIAIARIILRDPALLVLDEATSALDNESERMVQEALDRLMSIKKRTTVVIAHRLTTVRNADQIVVLNKGQVVERGTHDELLSAGGAYSRLYRMHEEQGAM